MPSRNSIVLIAVLILFSRTLSSLADEPISPADTPTAAQTPSPEQSEFVRSKVLPLLESRCFECHGTQDKIKGGLRLTSVESMLKGGDNGPAIVPSKPEESLLIQAVRYESFEMPPKSKIPDEEIAILSKWVSEGAPWPEDLTKPIAPAATASFPLQERIAAHWAWKKIARPDVPAVMQTDWPASDIDRFLLVKMEEAGVAPAPDADRRAILRRLYFDLIGLPPTIEQQEHFFNDPAETPVAIEKVVDDLLASPQFGERWARHWLDLVRYAETLGHEFDYPLPYAFRYRDYVIRALNADVPYDQFVREHIAGDLIEEPRRNPELGFNESIIATGFWFLGEDKHAPVDVRLDETLKIDNQIDVFSKTFLGLTVSCARCHDHKFDAITTEDYYGLAGFLQSSRRRVEWLDERDETKFLVESIQADRLAATLAIHEGLAQLRVDVREKLLLAALGEPSGGPHDLVTEDRIAAISEYLMRPTSKDLSNPLSLFATLMQKATQATEKEAIDDWLKRRLEALTAINAIEEGKGPSDFENGPLVDDNRNGWLQYGMAFTASVEPFSGCMINPGPRDRQSGGGFGGGFGGGSQVGFGGIGGGFGGDGSGGGPHPDRGLSQYAARSFALKWTPSGVMPDLEGGISSAALSPRLTGTLHSPEFELTHPEIHLLASGKNARVRLIIDGYVMHEFSELLFGGTRQPIDTDGQFHWIRIAGDTNRYIGHRCHLEFLDEGDGWFVVKEVRMAQEDEVSVSLPEVASTNQSYVNPEKSRKELVQLWAPVVANDPTWPGIALKLGLLPADPQQAIERASATWLKKTEQSPTGDPVLVMCDGTGEDEHIHIRGSHKNLGSIASRRLLTALDNAKPLNAPRLSGRMELADRVLAADNPFPARVMVNRVWQHLFGRGIVATSDNFGVMGEAPTHSELLDLLADDFRKDGWLLKRLIRKLVLTRAYRMSSQRSDMAEGTDPTNKLLHRSNIRRLEGESIRDAMLTVSGRLDSTMFGPSVPVYLTSFMQGRGRPGESGPLDGAGRRSIYQSVHRNFLNPFMLAFDTPQPASTIGRRSQSNVPAQALILLNNEFVHQQAETWAKRIAADSSQGGEEILRSAYRQAFARSPSDEELKSMTEFAKVLAVERASKPEGALKDAAILTDVCHVLLNQKEFLFLD